MPDGKWLQKLDSNQRPPGHEPGEHSNCSILPKVTGTRSRSRKMKKVCRTKERRQRTGGRGEIPKSPALLPELYTTILSHHQGDIQGHFGTSFRSPVLFFA